MMLDLLLAGLLATQAPAVTPTAAAAPAEAPSTPTLSALHQAQAEAHLAKLRVLQLEVQLRQQALEQERARIEQAIATAHPGWKFDWNTGQLVPVEAPK